MSTQKIQPFVAKLASDPDQVRNVKAITGFLGKSSQSGHHRIYYSTDLDHYVDVHEDAVLHSEEQEGNPAPSIFWISRDQPFIKSQVARQAGFLGGNISQQYLASTSAVPGGPQALTTIPCGTAAATLLLSCIGCTTLH